MQYLHQKSRQLSQSKLKHHRFSQNINNYFQMNPDPGFQIQFTSKSKQATPTKTAFNEENCIKQNNEKSTNIFGSADFYKRYKD